MDLKQVVNGVVLTKVCSIKADADSDVSKQVTLSVKFEGVALQSVFEKAMATVVVQWQNGPGRKHFDTWKQGQVIVVEFKAPGRAPAIDPREAMKARLASMTADERKAEIAKMLSEIE